MGKTVQIRDLPDDVHRELRVRAARAGLSLAEYLRREVTAVAHRPSVDDFLAEAARRATVVGPGTDVDAGIRADRDQR